MRLFSENSQIILHYIKRRGEVSAKLTKEGHKFTSKCMLKRNKVEVYWKYIFEDRFKTIIYYFKTKRSKYEIPTIEK